MSALSGFPPSNTVGPGVYINELDLSFIAPSVSFHRSGIVGFASKGPINVPTLITSTRQLLTTFGNPHPQNSDPYLIYASQQYLSIANELFVVRVAETSPVNNESAQLASVIVPAAGSPPTFISTVDTPSTITVGYGNGGTEPGFFRFRLNGILSSNILTVPAQTITSSGLAAGQKLVNILNAQLNPAVDGIQFSFVSSKINLATTFAYGVDASLELVSVQNAIYGGSDYSTNILGMATGATTAATTAGNTKYPSSNTTGNYDFTGFAATNFNLQVVVNGTDSVLIDNVVQVIDLSSLAGGTTTISDIVTLINNQITAGDIPGGFIASATSGALTLTTLTMGEDSQILVKSASTTFALFGFNGRTAVGTSISGTTGDGAIGTYSIVDGNSTSSGTTFTVTSDSPGIEGNLTQVVITNDIRTGSFSMLVYSNGNQVESWGNLTKNQASTLYVETFLSAVSNYILVNDNTSISAPPQNGTYSLSGGTDGIPADPDNQDALLIGSLAGYTGMYALSDPNQYDIDIISTPGHSSTAVMIALIDVAQNFRGDCIALIDPPFGLTVEEVVQWQNGAHPLNNVQLNSDFAALYWPWVQIFDTYNGFAVWVPPSGSIMAVYAASDIASAPWFAPAGVNRGIVPNIIDVFSRPTSNDISTLYGNNNAINPIIQFANTANFVVWGQKTLQRNPTALDRVNVRRLMFYIEKTIRQSVRTLLFDPNDAIFAQSFINICTSILQKVQNGRGITAFKIQVDATINTPDVVDRNEFIARIGVIPTRAVEFIYLEFSINNTGDFASSGS